MDSLNGSGGVQQFSNVQGSAGADGSLKGSKVSSVEADATPGLTDPGSVKSVSIKTRIANAWNNNWNLIGEVAKESILKNVSNPDVRGKASGAIGSHNTGVGHLKELKEEKTRLEHDVKTFEKEFKSMLKIATKGKFSAEDIKKGKDVAIKGSDGKLKVQAFKHNNKETNADYMRAAVKDFRSSDQFKSFTAKLDRIKDITQERAELKETLRNAGSQTAKDLKADAKQQHKDIRDGLRSVKGSEIDNARKEFKTKSDEVTNEYGGLKSGLKQEKLRVGEELKGLKSERSGAQVKVRSGLGQKWSNWHKQNIGAIAERFTPKCVSVDSGALKADRDDIKAGLGKDRQEVTDLGKKIDSRKREKDGLDNARNDFRKGRDDELKTAKNEKKAQKQEAKAAHGWDKLEEQIRHDDVKEANKDLSKALKGGKVKTKKK